MGVSKLIAFIGIAAIVMQPTKSASIGAPDNNCICTREYLPICGSDDITYTNDCLFNCEKKQNKNLEIKFYGECEDENQPEIQELIQMQVADECVCTFIYDPVCASNGKTYASECEFNCAKKLNKDLKVSTRGVCKEIKNLPAEKGEVTTVDQCKCSHEYRPVCGTDDETYTNECILNCNKLKKMVSVKYTGECGDEIRIRRSLSQFSAPVEEVDECVCTQNFKPVCGNDDVTYTNECVFNCAKKQHPLLELKFEGQCTGLHILPLILSSDVCICTMEYTPICGSDGKTYSNQCSFGCQQRIKSDLIMKHNGEC